MTISRRTLLASGAALGLLTACGSNTGRDKGSSPDGKVVLGHWYHQYGEAGTEAAVRRYAAAYDRAKVNVQWRPGNYDQQTAAALLTDSGPDVFEVNGPTLDQIRGGQVVDLTALLDGVKDDFNPAVLAPKTYDGRIWGIPQVVDTQFLYYRKSLLAAAGVQPPTTLDQLVDAARALT
ncbi:ABC transporter substrate-binding protein, partial [Streptomyces xanthochromogenes]